MRIGHYDIGCSKIMKHSKGEWSLGVWLQLRRKNGTTSLWLFFFKWYMLIGTIDWNKHDATLRERGITIG